MTRTIVVLIFPEFQLLDAAGPIAVFDTTARECTTPPYRLRIIANPAGPVTSSSGTQLMAEPLSDDSVDTLIIAAAEARARSPATPRCWLLSAPQLVGRGGLPAFARGPSFSRRSGCSTALQIKLIPASYMTTIPRSKQAKR
jgi:hypothetical protein